MQPVNEERLKNNLAKNIRYLRLMRTPKMSQETLAKKLGETRKSITRYETAVNLPPAHVLVAMAQFFGFTTDELLADRLPEKKGMKNNE